MFKNATKCFVYFRQGNEMQSVTNYSRVGNKNRGLSLEINKHIQSGYGKTVTKGKKLKN